nr:sodium/calcium exchanger NCL-like isoform X1 [Malus domestica]
MSNITKTAYWVVFVLLVIMVEVRGRSFGLNTQGTSSSQLVSDGIDHEYQNESTSSLLLLKRIENRYSTESSCEQLYGFLPCSNSVFGHVFLMVVYEYLLFHGESYLAAGGEQIFKILGPGVFGASAFHVIGALPESLLLLASGFFNSKEIAQEYVYTGVGLLAGSSILSLTILWGTCVIVSSQEFSNNLSSKASNDSNSSSFSWKRLSASLTDWGTTTDSETSSLARIMVCSVIPFLIMQMAKIFPSSSGERIAILTALSVSVVFLLLYFIYQIFRPWVQKRRLEFVKLGHLVSSILQHIQKHALARVLTVKGAPNIPAIRRLFEEVDDDGDNYVSPSEVRELLCEIKFISTEDEKDKGTEEVMKQFDLDHDGKINKDEFINGLDQVSA